MPWTPEPQHSKELDIISVCIGVNNYINMFIVIDWSEENQRNETYIKIFTPGNPHKSYVYF